MGHCADIEGHHHHMDGESEAFELLVSSYRCDCLVVCLSLQMDGKGCVEAGGLRRERGSKLLMQFLTSSRLCIAAWVLKGLIRRDRYYTHRGLLGSWRESLG